MSDKFEEWRNCCTGKPEFVDRWIRVVNESEAEEKRWIEDLRACGVKAAHPDDGWVDREANEVKLVYPQFNDGLEVGDLLALGWPNKERVVRVVEKTIRPFFGSIDETVFSFVDFKP